MAEPTLAISVTNWKPDEYAVKATNTGNGFIRVVVEPAEKALTQSVANIVAKFKADANEICGITLEPLKSYESLYVGACGHVFSDAIVQDGRPIKKCPVCRTQTAWTLVKIESCG